MFQSSSEEWLLCFLNVNIWSRRMECWFPRDGGADTWPISSLGQGCDPFLSPFLSGRRTKVSTKEEERDCGHAVLHPCQSSHLLFQRLHTNAGVQVPTLWPLPLKSIKKWRSSSSATPSSSKTCSTRENSFQSRRLWHIWRKLYLQLLEYHLLWLCLLQTSENKSWFPMLLLLASIWRQETPKCCRIIFSVNFLFTTFSTLSIF